MDDPTERRTTAGDAGLRAPVASLTAAGAAERARMYRALADSHRRDADADPLPQRRRVLALSARQYGYLAEVEEKIAREARKAFLLGLPGEIAPVPRDEGTLDL
jgi:hypothetical protein